MRQRYNVQIAPLGVIDRTVGYFQFKEGGSSVTMAMTISSGKMAAPTPIGTLRVVCAGLPTCSATGAGTAAGAALSFMLGV
jgi:hypothetical protein